MCRSELEQERVHTSEVRHLSISRKKKRVFVTATGLLLSAQHMHLAEYKRPRAFYLSRTNASGGGSSGVPSAAAAREPRGHHGYKNVDLQYSEYG